MSTIAVLVSGGIAIPALVCILLNSYGDRKTCPWYVQTVAFISWLGPFFVPFLLPLDLTSTLYKNCQERQECALTPPFTYVEPSVLRAMWSGVYWSAFVLTWGTIPMLQAYLASGAFDFWTKVKDAARANFIYYLTFGAVGGCALVYVAVKKEINTAGALMAFVMAASNSWGLTLVIAFLGYGLVATPRNVWRSANARQMLRKAEFRANQLQEDAEDAESELNDILQEVSIVDRRVYQNHALRPAVEVLLGSRPSIRRRPAVNHSSEYDPPDVITLKYMTTLHVKLKNAVKRKNRDVCMWKLLCDKAFFLEDIVDNAESPDRKFRSTLRPPRTGPFSEARMTLEWWWFIHLRPFGIRCTALLCGLMSFCIFWSELTFNKTNPMLSLLGLALHDNVSYARVEIIALVTLSYMCICVYSNLMKVRIFSLYELVPSHHTDPRSLLFVGAYLCRLTMPLSYNFLNLATENVETVFSDIMGKINLVPLFGSTYNSWMPTTILIPVILTLFDVYGHLLHICQIRPMFSSDDEEVDLDLSEGQRVLAIAREREEARLGGSVTPGEDRGAIQGHSTRITTTRRREESGSLSSSYPRAPVSGSSAHYFWTAYVPDALRHIKFPWARRLSSDSLEQRERLFGGQRGDSLALDDELDEIRIQPSFPQYIDCGEHQNINGDDEAVDRGFSFNVPRKQSLPGKRIFGRG